MGHQCPLYLRILTDETGRKGGIGNARNGCQFGKQATAEGEFLEQGFGEIGLMAQAVKLFCRQFGPGEQVCQRRLRHSWIGILLGQSDILLDFKDGASSAGRW